MLGVNENFLSALDEACRLMKHEDANAVQEAYKDRIALHREKRLQNAATDIMSTGNTGYGAEAVVDVEYTDELYSMVSQLPGLLPMLPANHGQKKGDSVKVDVIGEAALFDSATEPTGSQSTGGRTTNNAIQTGQVSITMKEFNAIFGISKKALHDSISGAQAFLNKIQNRILLGMNRTIEAYIINADPAAQNTNINYINNGASPGTMPAAAYYLLGGQGLRYQGINHGIVGGNVAFTRGAIILQMLRQLNNYQNDVSNLLWLTSGYANTKIAGTAEYATRDKFENPTNQNGPVLGSFENIGNYIPKDLTSLVNVAGKIEYGDDAANDFNQMLLIHKYAPQYAFGRDVDIVVSQDSQRIFFDVTFSFGCDINTGKAGLGQTVSVGVFQN